MLESYQNYSDEDLAALNRELERAALNDSAPWHFHALWIVGCIVGIGGTLMIMSRSSNVEQLAVLVGLACLFFAYRMERSMFSSRETHLRLYRETAREIERRQGGNFARSADHAPESPAQSGPINLPFKSHQAAFEYACKYLERPVLKNGEVAPCLVVSLTKPAHAEWVAEVLVPSREGGSKLLVALPENASHLGVTGKMCVVLIGPALSIGIQELPVGLLVAVLAPEWNSIDGWKIERKLS